MLPDNPTKRLETNKPTLQESQGGSPRFLRPGYGFRAGADWLSGSWVASGLGLQVVNRAGVCGGGSGPLAFWVWR